MSQFLNETMIDMRNGRETWRVFLAFGGPAFVLAIAVALLQVR